jgi:plastocyanin
MRRLIVVLVAGTALLTLTACGGSDNGGTPAAVTSTLPVAQGEVVVANIAYSPGTITVSAGQTVTWKFADNGVPHTVTSDPGSPQAFNSQQKTDGTFPVKFASAGRYPYHCEVHKKMHGTVVVS